MFFLNLLFAAIWMILRNEFSPEEFFIGFLLSFIAIAATQRAWGESSYVQRIIIIVELMSFSIWVSIKSNLALARLILMRKPDIRPGVVAIPLDVHSDTAIGTLALLLSLIPGTISLDVSHDKQTLYIHAIFVTNPDVFRQTVKQEFEQRVAAVLAEDKARHV